jgi:hypothetical protein
VSTLSAASRRQIMRAQQERRRVDWEQIPLMPALIPPDMPDPAPGDTHAYHKAVAPGTPKGGLKP